MRHAQDVEGADEVDIDHGFESIGRHAERRAGKIARRAGDQHVDRAERVMRRFERRRDGLSVAHIGGKAGDVGSPSARKLLQRLIEPFLRPADDRDFGAGRGEGLGDAKIDAAGAARDKDGAPGKVEYVSPHRPAISPAAE